MKIINISHVIRDLDQYEKTIEISCLVDTGSEKKVFKVMNIIPIGNSQKQQKYLFLNLISAIIDHYGFTLIDTIEI